MFGEESPSPKWEWKYFTLEEFEVQSMLSRGAFGWVFLVKHPEKGFFVLKWLEKKSIEKDKHLQLVLNERNILRAISSNKKLDSSFLIKCYETMQDKNALYFLLEFTPGGELWTYMKWHLAIKRESLVFYAAEILCAVE